MIFTLWVKRNFYLKWLIQPRCFQLLSIKLRSQLSLISRAAAYNIFGDSYWVSQISTLISEILFVSVVESKVFFCLKSYSILRKKRFLRFVSESYSIYKFGFLAIKHVLFSLFRSFSFYGITMLFFKIVLTTTQSVLTIIQYPSIAQSIDWLKRKIYFCAALNFCIV